MPRLRGASARILLCVVALALGQLLLSSCALSCRQMQTASYTSRVTRGMTPAQVREAVGAPHREEGLTWIYFSDRSSVFVIFKRNSQGQAVVDEVSSVHSGKN